MNNMPWHDIYNTEQMKHGEVYGPPVQVSSPLVRTDYAEMERRYLAWAASTPKPKRKDRPKPKTTKNKRRMKKASKKKNRKRK